MVKLEMLRMRVLDRLRTSGGRDGRGLCGWRRKLLWGGLYSGAEAVAL